MCAFAHLKNNITKPLTKQQTKSHVLETGLGLGLTILSPSVIWSLVIII
jgi:hypothetical protein